MSALKALGCPDVLYTITSDESYRNMDQKSYNAARKGITQLIETHDVMIPGCVFDYIPDIFRPKHIIFLIYSVPNTLYSLYIPSQTHYIPYIFRPKHTFKHFSVSYHALLSVFYLGPKIYLFTHIFCLKSYTSIGARLSNRITHLMYAAHCVI